MDRLFQWFNIAIYDLANFNKDISKHIYGNFLDIGCGSKQKIFQASVKRYIGLEYPSSRQINKQLSNTQADIFGDAHYLPFKNESFDSVTALSLFEHLSEPQSAARESYRVLKKGGIFAVTVPFMNRIHMAPYDFFRFTVYGIRHILEDSGFTIIKIIDGGGMWKMIGYRLAGYLYSDVLGLGYGSDDIEVKPKKYLLPIFAPFIIFIVLLCRFLDKIHCVKKDTLHYYVLCRK